MYYFVDWKRIDEGFVPALPEEMGFLLLAEPSEHETYGIFSVDVPTDEFLPFQINAVSEDLADLIKSAEQYPPALALARDKVREVSGLNRTAFGKAFAEILRGHLVSQRTSPFFLAEAKRTETGYKSAGAFYWIVRANALKSV